MRGVGSRSSTAANGRSPRDDLDAGTATGAFPPKVNYVVEWRGTETKGRFTPYAVIYLTRLDGAESKIVGHADEPNSEAKARRIADREC